MIDEMAGINKCDNCNGDIAYEMPSWRSSEYDAFTHHKRIAYKVIEGRDICITCISRQWY